MPLLIVRDDITRIKVDAIVNATNSELIGSGGVDKDIHEAAGPMLDEACAKLKHCAVGSAVITDGYLLRAKYIIHAVGPKWNGGDENEETLLASCYSSALELAKSNGIETIAFPVISSGTLGYPKAEAIRIARDTIKSFLLSPENRDYEITVYIVLYDDESFEIGSDIFGKIKNNIPDFIAKEEELLRFESCDCRYSREGNFTGAALDQRSKMWLSAKAHKSKITATPMLYTCEKAIPSLKDFIKEQKRESFSSRLLHLIDNAGCTDVECYKRANISRKVFSKIRSDKDYMPRLDTAVAFAISLRLSFDETQELLQTAGLSLSKSKPFDLIITYCIRNGIYDIYQVNEILFDQGQRCLGVLN